MATKIKIKTFILVHLNVGGGGFKILGSLFIREIVRHWNWRKSPEALRRHFKLKKKKREYELYKLCYLVSLRMCTN